MNLTVKTAKPIVFVGAQRPWTGLSGDGPRNLYDAVRVAASRDAWNKGVLHCMNQFINTAREVNKNSAYRVHTFSGIDVGAIGFADISEEDDLDHFKYFLAVDIIKAI